MGALPKACNCVYGAEVAVPIATLLELLPEYSVVDGCSRASVICHALVVCEAFFVDDTPVYVDCVLLVVVDRGNQGVGDAEDSVPGDD